LVRDATAGALAAGAADISIPVLPLVSPSSLAAGAQPFAAVAQPPQAWAADANPGTTKPTTAAKTKLFNMTYLLVGEANVALRRVTS
jgi:P2-related tail formation protein